MRAYRAGPSRPRAFPARRHVTGQRPVVLRSFGFSFQRRDEAAWCYCTPAVADRERCCPLPRLPEAPEEP